MRTLSLLLALTLTVPALAADPPGVKHARKLWEAAQADKKAGELVEHKVALNANNRSWPGVGDYNEAASFFVRLNPEAKDAVVLVEYRGVSAAYVTDATYLYDAKGELRFAWVKEISEHQLRVYFDDKGRVIRMQIDDDKHDKVSKKMKVTAAAVRAHARRVHRHGAELIKGLHSGLFPEDVEGLTEQ